MSDEGPRAPSERPPVRFAAGPHGARIAYAVHGDGPLLVCPPWWVSHVERDWDYAPFRAFFERLGAGRRVVRYDRLGNGLSDAARGAPTLESELELLECVVAALSPARFALFAVSSATPPALAFAAQNSERVERVVVYGGYARGSDLAPPEVQRALALMVRAHWGLASRTLADVFVPDASSSELEALAAWQRAASDGPRAAALLELTYAMDVADRLATVGVPVVVMHRRGDRAVPFAAGRRIAASVPGAELVVLEGRAHPPWEGGDDVADALASTFGTFGTSGSDRASPSAPALRLDRENRELVSDGARVPLTPLELATLAFFEQNADRVVTRDELVSSVWKQSSTGSNVVDALVRVLRKKLGAHRDRIETVPGHGYRFRRR